DGGKTWSKPRDITSATKFGQSAQWQPWSTFDQSSGKLLAAYYDRSYGNCEMSGCNDITLATISNPGGSAHYSYKRITTRSMPNLTPANNPVQAGFLGDYMWVAQGGGRTHVVWADTRG